MVHWHTTKRKEALPYKDLPYLDVGFQVSIPSFTSGPVTKIEFREERPNSSNDKNIYRNVANGLLSYDDACQQITQKDTLFRERLHVSAVAFLDNSLADSDQFWHGIRQLVRKALGISFTGANDALNAKLKLFAKFLIDNAASLGLTAVTPQAKKKVAEQVAAFAKGSETELRDVPLQTALKVLQLYADMVGSNPHELCTIAVKETLISPMFDPNYAAQRFSQDFFFLGFVLCGTFAKSQKSLATWLVPMLISGGKNPSKRTMTGYNFESVQSATWMNQILSVSGVSDEDSVKVLRYKLHQTPAFRYLWALAKAANVYNSTYAGFRSQLKTYYGGKSKMIAIDEIIPRHNWTVRDERSIIGKLKLMWDDEEQNTDPNNGVIVRADMKRLHYELVTQPPVDEYGRDVSYELIGLRKVTKGALNFHIKSNFLSLSLMALCVSVPLAYLFTPDTYEMLKDAGVVDGMKEDDAKPKLIRLRDKLKDQILKKNKERQSQESLKRERNDDDDDNDSVKAAAKK